MATPASSAYAFHHRFDAVPDQQASKSDQPSSTAPNGADHFEYPDLDAGQFYSSAATHTAPAPAPSKLPEFPEFKGFDSKTDLFSNNTDLFSQYAPQPKATATATATAAAAAAALIEPQSAQLEAAGSEPNQLSSTSTPSSPHQASTLPTTPPPQQPQQPPASRPPQEAAIAAVNDNLEQQQQQQPPEPQQPYQPQLERHFSSASSYVQRPSLHTTNPDSQAPSHYSHPSPLPKPPSLPNSPPTQHSAPNGASHPQATSPRSPPVTAFAFASQPASDPTSAHSHNASPPKPFPQPSAEALSLADLQINDQERATHQQPPPQPATHRDENGDRARPSSFFGMQRPAAALNAAGQHVPVPASMLADDDGFYQDHQHLNQPNAPAQPQQRIPHDQGPRPSSFFGLDADSPSSITPEPASIPTPTSEPIMPGPRSSSFLRAESVPRGISTAAGGTGNAPMPASGGYGGLGPAGATRPASIAPSVASGPLLDHSHLKVGQKASLLSHGKTLELYRQNAKKTNDPNLIYELAVFMVDAAKTMGTEDEGASPATAVNGPNKVEAQKEELMKEATGLLKKIADRGHPDAQYFLADCYANGIGTRTGKQDFGSAYTYFVLAAKHGHPDAAYRAGTCYEKGWGCRKDTGKALQFYRKSAAQSHPGAMYRLATAELNGELGLKKNAKEGVKWLKRSAEAATPEFPHALHELALLHERGIDNVLFVDPEYSCELLAQAGEMGYAPSAYKLGVNYEYGRMGCPQDGGLSIHMYNIAAQQNHKEACFALTAWYLVGAPGILPQSDTEAYLWAKKAAEQGLAKAEYAVGYFTEMGIGTVKDIGEARAWYKRAADHGDKRANQRIAALQGRGGPTSLAGVGAGAQLPAMNRQQQRMEQRQEQRESMHEFGRRAQPTSAPFPASVTQSSMTPSTQMSYPSPLAMREAQTQQREQQYLANVAANERAQARAILRHSPSQPDMGSPISAGASPVIPLPRSTPFAQQQPPHPQQPHQQQPPPQAYPSYPMSASTAPPAPTMNGHMQQQHNPMFPPTAGHAARPGVGSPPGPSGPGYGPGLAYGGPNPASVAAAAGAPPGPQMPSPAGFSKDDDKKKKKGWFGR